MTNEQPTKADIARYSGARAALAAQITKASDRALAAQIAPLHPPPTKRELDRAYDWTIDSLCFLSLSRSMEACD